MAVAADCFGQVLLDSLVESDHGSVFGGIDSGVERRAD